MVGAKYWTNPSMVRDSLLAPFTNINNGMGVTMPLPTKNREVSDKLPIRPKLPIP